MQAVFCTGRAGVTRGRVARFTGRGRGVMSGRMKEPRAPRTSDPERTSPKGGTAREDRLKAALKANIARRKAQAKARSQDPGEQEQDG
ncbi:hypothetical protein SAMN05444417_0302 [Wenxinia saemankumensis]|uniref:Uncharacterized protein n=2 Tax=Wenxinia saemankumensis TaxID=1447782 RepID=A0A1M6A915_9RHOB|nr:hypothetical protein SAMN05444417_0302 [Wenxinia saemankumensis]